MNTINSTAENHFIIRLLMDKECEMPSKVRFGNVLDEYLGAVNCFGYNTESASFDALNYHSFYEKVAVNPQLMVSKCVSTESWNINPAELTQMWECPEHEEILSKCRYQVVAGDMLAEGMTHKERADMLMNFLEALLELYPECRAVYFENSGKLFTKKKIQRANIEKDERFIYYAVNIRLFNVRESEEVLVDTIGMQTLSLPDLQYHFKGIDPNLIMEHAYNVLSLMYMNGAVINDGDTIDGIQDGELCEEVQWECHYTQSKVQPARRVIDFKTGEYSAE